MKYLLAIILSCLVITSANATNTCNFRSFCVGDPISPLDLNYNFEEVKNCTNSGPAPGSDNYKGCVAWEGAEVTNVPENTEVYTMPLLGYPGNLGGGQALLDAGNDARLSIIVTNVPDDKIIDITINIYNNNHISILKNPIKELNIGLQHQITKTFYELLHDNIKDGYSIDDAAILEVLADNAHNKPNPRIAYNSLKLNVPASNIALSVQAYACFKIKPSS